MYTFNHFNFNVTDLDRSLAFYKQALGLEPVGKTIAPEDGGFVITYLGDGKTDFRLELTMTAEDYDEALAKHKAMGCVCFENPDMGIYFIEDPDGYWIEIVPQR